MAHGLHFPIARPVTPRVAVSKILAYSRAKGLFAGATLQGSSLHADQEANEDFYGTRLDSKDIVLDGKLDRSKVPQVVSTWQTTLARLTSKTTSS